MPEDITLDRGHRYRRFSTLCIDCGAPFRPSSTDTPECVPQEAPSMGESPALDHEQLVLL